MKTKVSVIIPTLNEEKAIGKVLDNIPKNKKYLWEVIVVDGNSNDNTRKIARKKGAKVIIEKRRGYGRAYKTGFAKATGSIIATTDGDGTYPAEKIDKLVDYLLKNNLDFISCERFSKLQRGAMSFSHFIGNKLLNLTLNFLFGLHLKDSQSGMWIFRKRILKSLNLTSDGMPFSEEIKIEAFKKFKCKEVPIEYHIREGMVKLNTLRDGYHNFVFLIKKRFNL